MNLEILLLLPLAGLVVNLILVKVKLLKKLVALLVTGASLWYGFLLVQGSSLITPLVFMGQNIGFHVTPLGYYFVLMITGLSFLTVLFSWKFMDKEKDDTHYYSWLYLKVFGMLGVVLAGDLLSFFMLWELMSWSTYFLMRQGHHTRKSAYKYMIYAITSGMLLLFSVMLIYGRIGSFDFNVIREMVGTLPIGTLLLLAILLLTSFSIEAAVWPLHQWVPDSYAEAYTPITAFLAGISTRMGAFAIIFFVFSIFGIPNLDKMVLIGRINFRYIFMWFAALTMVIPTFTALLQNDGKKLMTWHGIGQGGYILLGVAVGSPLGVAGGLFHIVNYLTYISLILFSLAAVEYRTGTTNLNKLGGLIKKQPVAFLGVLVGIIGLAGIPPMNGFVSKWMIYRALILGHYPFLATMAFIGTLGTILSVYKFIHNIFLGQLRKEYDTVKEVPIVMQIPIWILMLAVYVLGVYPGVVLKLIAKIQISFGLEPLAYTLNGVASRAGDLNMFVVNMVFWVGIALAFLVFWMGSRRKHISQYSNYAAGNFIDENTKYNYNYHFYAAIEHIIAGKLMKDFSYKLERGLKAFMTEMSDFTARIYTGNLSTYTMYIFSGLLILLFLVKGAV